jgi:hypothetical protein
VHKPVRFSTLAAGLLKGLGVQLQSTSRKMDTNAKMLVGKRLLVVHLPNTIYSFLELPTTNCQHIESGGHMQVELLCSRVLIVCWILSLNLLQIAECLLHRLLCGAVHLWTLIQNLICYCCGFCSIVGASACFMSHSNMPSGIQIKLVILHFRIIHCDAETCLLWCRWMTTW